jgi:hypothetical protein
MYEHPLLMAVGSEDLSQFIRYAVFLLSFRKKGFQLLI